MEDLEQPGSPTVTDAAEPQGNADPGEQVQPDIDEENEREAPLAQPTADTEVFGDEETPETVQAMREDEDLADEGPAAVKEDDESELEELSEKEFEDFDPSALNIPEKPVAVDSDNVGLLGVHKRKRTEEEERERKKKKKEGRRQKTKKVRAGGDDDDEVDANMMVEGKRRQKNSKLGADGEKIRRPRAAPRERTPENEEDLSPEDRRRRALDRKMDEALKSHRPTARRRGGIALEEMADAEIESMRQRMAKACELDAEARSQGRIATHKLKILPEVVELMNRNTIQSQLVDPDINILEAVRFMLEPADVDAALPNYQIQRELFNILKKLNIGKEALVASGIGKVVLFYTKSIQPQQDIKRDAERLVGEWMRVVLKKPKNARNKPIETKQYDPLMASQQARNRGPELSQAERLAIANERRKRMLAQPIPGNRARADTSGLATYTVAPVNNMRGAVDSTRTVGEGSFRRIVGRSQAAKGKR